jgi:hypothetical protein
LTTPNSELAYQVLDHIDAHPELWRQDVYIGKAECGTVACFAGWACLLSGDKPKFWGQDWATVELVSAGMVADRAQELLRADRHADEGTDLFDQYNTREDLGRLVAEIFGPRPEPTA